MRHLAVIGAGAWGTALAAVAASAGATIRLLVRDPAVAEAINRHHVNPPYLPDIVLDPSLTATTDTGAALADVDGVLLVVPAQFMRSVLTALWTHLPETSRCCSAPRVSK